MVDDMPILSADQGEVDFNLIPMETIDKIEIIKEHLLLYMDPLP